MPKGASAAPGQESGSYTSKQRGSGGLLASWGGTGCLHECLALPHARRKDPGGEAGAELGLVPIRLRLGAVMFLLDTHGAGCWEGRLSTRQGS